MKRIVLKSSIILVILLFMLNQMSSKIYEHSGDAENSLRLIDSVNDSTIGLYENHDALVLHVNKTYYDLDIPYITPRYVEPRLQVFDLDEDKEDEVIIITYIGSGTGVSVSELHVYELAFSDEDTLNDKIVSKTTFLIDDHRQEIANAFQTDIEKKDTQTLLFIKHLDEEYAVDLNKVLESDETIEIINPFYYGDIIDFNINNNNIRMTLGLAVICEDIPIPVYYGNLNIELGYKNGVFSLDRFHIEIISEYK